MKKRIFIAIFWLSIFGLYLAGSKYFNSAREPEMRESAVAFPIMSTQATLKFYAKDETEIENAVRYAQEAMERVVRICNYFDPESELSRLNTSAAKKPFFCSAELWTILTEVRRFHKISNGAFDPTIRPLMKVWGFHRKRKTLPSEQEIAEAKKLCGFDKLVFDDENRTVFFKTPGMSLDLGGIAKGWAIDRAADAVLMNTAVRAGILDLGGNMRCLPEPPPGKDAYTIAVKDPKNPEKLCAVVPMQNECVATSGNYERYVVIDGKHYTHIIDPRTGHPVEGVLSSTVVTKRGVDSDALSTSIFIDGALKVPDARILRIAADGEVSQKIPEGQAPFRLLE